MIYVYKVYYQQLRSIVVNFSKDLNQKDSVLICFENDYQELNLEAGLLFVCFFQKRLVIFLFT